MYEAVTRDIRVRVTPQYLEEESAPDERRYLWSYTIEIANEGSEIVQLRSTDFTVYEEHLKSWLCLSRMRAIAAQPSTRR